MTDLELDIWNEWLREKQNQLNETLSLISAEENPYRYYRIEGHIDGLIDALTMLTTIEEGKRFRQKLNAFRSKLLLTNDYDINGNYIQSQK